MCFSATASFTGAGIIGSIGVATLRHVREPRTLPFACVPMLFALHQATEGMVWLGLEGKFGRIGLDHVAFLFTLWAQGFLPLFMPAAVALMEPPGRRRWAIAGLTAVGAIVCAWDVTGLVFLPSRVFIEGGSIAYRNRLTGSFPISCLYIVATCGSLLLSSHRVVRWYGVLNVIALTIVEIVKAYTFASVWCFYAAIMSIVIYRQFAGRKIEVERPVAVSGVSKPVVLPRLRLAGRAAAGTR